MGETQLLSDLVQSCRMLAHHQKSPNVLDMLHDLEEDFIQKAKSVESGKRHAGREQPRRNGKGLRTRQQVAPHD
jgi:hypothetical protein